jgi:biotin operon repressor
MPKMSKKEQEEEISKFLKFIDFELENWGIYKDSPEMQKIEKDKIIIGILQLSEAIQTAIIPKLIEAGIFTANEINEAFKIPIEKRNLINIKDLMESDIKPDKMLVGGGLIPEIIGFALIGGLAKEGKTLLSLQLGLNLISGTNFLEDFKVNRKCKILYIYRENTKSGLNEIIKKQISGLKKTGIDIKLNDLENFYTYYGKDIVLDIKYPRLENLKKAVKIVKPDIIFLDPIGQFIGFDINKAENIKNFKDLLEDICGCFWVLIHHYTKPRLLAKGESDIPPIYKLLGSSYLANACETFLGLEPEGERYSKDYKRIYFTIRREREPIPMHLKRDSNSLIYEVVDSISLITGRITKEDIARVLKHSFKGKASYTDLANLCSDQFGVKEERVAKLMKELKESGIIDKEKGKRGYWYIKELFSDHF